MSGSAIIAGFEPNAKQLDAARACLDPKARVIVLDGAIRSGKTQAAGRLLVEMAVEQPAVYLVGRATYRSLRDSTMKAMVYGDGALSPLIPPELVEQVRLSDELVRLKSGAEILFRSLEEASVSKILNLSLGGVLIDQIEELDGGDAGERVYDTVLGRLSDPRGPRKLIAVANPAGIVGWQYRRLIDEGTRDRFVRRVHFALRDNAANLPGDYVESMEATRLTRPAWYRTYIAGEWGAFEGQAFAEFDDAVHVVEPFEVPESWYRWEAMDHGAASPTAWGAWAVDEDGNVVCFGEHYEAGKLISHHARTVHELRKRWHPDGFTPTVYADPSTGAKLGYERWGSPSSIKTEYADHGIALYPANNDRRAGYARLLELIHVEPGRIPPRWAQVPESAGGAPRLYVFSTCKNVIAQLKSAPVATEGQDVAEAVDPKWESAHGHAVAMCRYSVMSRPSPSEPPADPFPETEQDLRRDAMRRLVERERDGEEDADVYVLV